MRQLNLDKHRATAEAATKGPWRWGDWSASFGQLEDPDHMFVLERNLTAGADSEPYRVSSRDGRHEVLRTAWAVEKADDAAYLAANDPSTTLALLDYIRELQSLALEVAPDKASKDMVCKFIERGVVVAP